MAGEKRTPSLPCTKNPPRRGERISSQAPGELACREGGQWFSLRGKGEKNTKKKVESADARGGAKRGLFPGKKKRGRGTELHQHHEQGGGRDRGASQKKKKGRGGKETREEKEKKEERGCHQPVKGNDQLERRGGEKKELFHVGGDKKEKGGRIACPGPILLTMLEKEKILAPQRRGGGGGGA